MRRPYFRGARGSLIVLGLALCACSSANTTTPSITTTTLAPSVPGTNSVSDLITSACLTGASRADLRQWLQATGRTADKVELFLQEYDAMMKTGDCN